MKRLALVSSQNVKKSLAVKVNIGILKNVSVSESLAVILNAHQINGRTKIIVYVGTYHQQSQNVNSVA